MRGLLTIILSIVFLSAYTQGENRLIRKGNNQFEDGNYEKAEINYIKSLEENQAAYKGKFNLGTAYYMQNTYEEAASSFDTLKNYNLDDETMAGAYYNLGNSLLKMALDTNIQSQDALPKSIEAYKNSLRLNPQDHDAKYNLAYAKKLLSDQQQQQQNQDQQNQDQNEDQEQEQQDQQQQDQQQQEQQEQEQQQNKKDEQQAQNDQQQQQQQPQEISKEDAERMLEALKNDEKQTLEKLKKATVKVSTTKSEKDW